MNQELRFNGRLNTDDTGDLCVPGDVMDARNITYRGTTPRLKIQTSVGNTLRVNTYLPNTGIDQTIGGLYDPVKQRLFSFIWNSNGSHTIIQYNVKTGIFSKLLQCFTDSQSDILNFDLNYPIASINILYTSEDIGDILHWTARNNRPMKLNIKDALASLYGTNWIEDYLTVARPMPLIAPTCAYANDASVTINNLRKKLYEFRYRWVYKDLTKSTWSPWSKLFAPANPDDVATDVNETKNNRIDVTIDTGNADVISIEIAARQTLSTTFSDPFLTATLNKSLLGLTSNILYVFNFFNDSSYPYVDLEESLLLFDKVPYRANCQEFLNGNTPIYGGITEGYNFDEILDTSVFTSLIDFTITSALTYSDILTPRYYTVGFSGSPATGDKVVIFVEVDNGGFIQATFQYTVLIGDTLTDIRDALVSDINSSGTGFTAINTTIGASPALKIQYSVLLAVFNQGVTSITLSGGGSGTVDGVANSIYKHKSRYQYGIVSFDKDGVTNGVVTYNGLKFITQEVTTTGATATKIPQITLQISHQPPIWAYYFSIVRTLNLSVSYLLPTVSCATDKDTVGTSKYAYLNIKNQQFNQNGYSAYEYTPGDRVRIIGKYSTSVGTVYDFPIVDFKTDPVINGAAAPGNWLIIPYDAVLSTFGTDQNFDIEIYTPAPNASSDQQVFYEFGESYTVLNPGTAARAHSGMIQSQVAGTTLRTSDTPTAPTAALLVTPGLLNIGAYSYKIEFVLSNGVNSIPSPVSNTVTTVPGSQQISLSAIDTSADPNVVARNIYRTISNGATYYQVATINDNVTTTFVDNVPDGSLIAIMPQQAIYYFTRGDFYLKKRNMPFNADLSGVADLWVVDQSVSDFFPSKVVGNGRAFIVDEYAKQIYFPTTVRWGLAYQQDTNINQTNRFKTQNFDEIDRQKGDIQRLLTEERLLYVYQNRGVGQYGVYNRFISNSDGTNQLVTTNEIITANNIQYLVGEFGLGDQYTGIARGRNVHYFIDPVRGLEVRRSSNGLEPISLQNKGQYYISTLLTPFNKTWVRPDGSNAKILMAYDFFEDEAIAFTQAGVIGSQSIDAYTFTFHEGRNTFSSFFDFHPEWMLCVENTIFSWLNGEMYTHDNQTTGNYYGVQYDSYVIVPFNINLLEKKTWISLTEVASHIWDCPLIYSNVNTFTIPTIQRQESKLIIENFKSLESDWHASFLNDINSVGGWLNGGAMKGNFLVIKFRASDSGNLVTLTEVSIKFIDSPLTST